MQQIDILTYIALSEEFDAVFHELGVQFRPEEIRDVAITLFVGEVYSPSLARTPFPSRDCPGRKNGHRSGGFCIVCNASAP